jgi:hypothetical protein
MSITLFDDFRKEFKVDNDGNVTSTIRGVARLCGIATPTLSKHFRGVSISEGKMTKILVEHGFCPLAFSKTKVPAQAVSLILYYYAFEAGLRCTEQAKKIFLAFSAIGFQEWLTLPCLKAMGFLRKLRPYLNS